MSKMKSPTDVNNGLAVLGIRLIVDDEKANEVMDVTRLFEKCHDVGEQNPINGEFIVSIQTT